MVKSEGKLNACLHRSFALAIAFTQVVQAKDTDFRFSIYQGRYIAVHCPDCSPPRPEASTPSSSITAWAW
jgi:hypothetical protein